ncbi:TPA: glycosyltransferase family 4 protein [Serratia odorifera]|jgi:glycogen synthase|uniref:Sugar transferase, PEP-CTERM/EpsH1 system associated n=1 Tax=Serratia odorifera TaxID=618 RepID=A0A3S4HW38_SEROD|nr:glycosyltransferase family 4 protein [Serratia odorifera]MBJ2064036.1 glycosyltransferase family 4 protein [Serratia odorifera]PNK88701.1 hypothetical protein CEQ31_002805 [Serratia odorifera]RII69504.1 glycosyltransferase [Serratia odorifera]VDZ65158.1 sugar transferase, PEP-CTERM/EpsH1 system associated [Serratia odorifera]
MKIVIINTLYAPYKIGGAEVSVQMLAESLVKLGHQVCVFCLHEGDEIKKDTINGVQVSYFPLLNLYWPFKSESPSKYKKALWHLLDIHNPFMAKRVSQALAEIRPDVVHTNNLSGFSVAVWQSAKKLGARVVHTTRDYYLFHPNGTLFKNGQNMDVNGRSVRVTSWLKKAASQKVDAFVGISQYISNLHKDNGFASQAQHAYVYNSVEPIDYTPTTSDNIRIGFVGRLTEDKGFDEFCALAKAAKQDPRAEFYAAGRFNNGVSGEEMAAMARDAGVILLGFIKVDAFMAQVDAVVLPTRWNEPFGRAVAESAISGKVVYTTFSGGVTEIANFYDNIFEIKNFTIEGAIDAVKANQNRLRTSCFEKEKIASSYEGLYRG